MNKKEKVYRLVQEVAEICEENMVCDHDYARMTLSYPGHHDVSFCLKREGELKLIELLRKHIK